MKLLIMNWTGDRKNWGCQATSHGMLADIQEAVAPEWTVEPCFYPFGDHSFRDRFVERFFRPFVLSCLLAPELDRRAGRRLSLLTKLCYLGRMRALEEADLVVFSAEGTLSDDVFHVRERPLLMPYMAAVWYGKKVISLNQTLPAESDELNRLVANVYRHFQYVTVREPSSLSLARRVGLTGVSYHPDAAFRTLPSDIELAEKLDGTPVAPLLAMTGSGGYDHAHRDAYMRTVCEFAARHGMQVCGLFWKRRWIESLCAVQSSFGGPRPVFPRPDCKYRDISAILAHCQGLVGGRYHSSIQAAAVRTPFVPLFSCTHKTDGLVQMLEWPLVPRAWDDLSGIGAGLEEMLARRDELSKHLERRVREIARLRQEAIGRLGQEIRRLVLPAAGAV